MIESFIPNELAIAPNPLGLPSNLRLTTIPIADSTQFELWLPIADKDLLPQEGVLLKVDCSRLEEICERLTWLLGARLVWFQSNIRQSVTYDWQVIKQLLQQNQVTYNALAIAHQPQAVHPHITSSASSGWVLYPASWSILLLDLQSLEHGFRVTCAPVEILLTMGESLIRQEHRPAIAVN